MINGNLSQFLDTGWYSEGTIYFSGYIYWCEGDTNPETGISHFWVNRWRAETEENKLYRSIIDCYVSNMMSICSPGCLSLGCSL